MLKATSTEAFVQDSQPWRIAISNFLREIKVKVNAITAYTQGDCSMGVDGVFATIQAPDWIIDLSMYEPTDRVAVKETFLARIKEAFADVWNEPVLLDVNFAENSPMMCEICGDEMQAVVSEMALDDHEGNVRHKCTVRSPSEEIFSFSAVSLT